MNFVGDSTVPPYLPIAPATGLHLVDAGDIGLGVATSRTRCFGFVQVGSTQNQQEKKHEFGFWNNHDDHFRLIMTLDLLLAATHLPLGGRSNPP